MITAGQREWLSEHLAKDGYVRDGAFAAAADDLLRVVGKKPKGRKMDSFLNNLDRHEASAAIVYITSFRERHRMDPDTGEPCDTGLAPLFSETEVR